MTDTIIKVGEVVRLSEIPENHYFYKEGYIFRTIPPEDCNSDLLSVQVHEVTIGASDDLQKEQIVDKESDDTRCVYLGDNEYAEEFCRHLKKVRSLK